MTPREDLRDRLAWCYGEDLASAAATAKHQLAGKTSDTRRWRTLGLSHTASSQGINSPFHRPADSCGKCDFVAHRTAPTQGKTRA